MAEVSIILPVYNTEKYLDKCLTSLKNQTYKDFDVFAINDGSTDKSQEILEKYEEDKKIQLTILNQENKGAAKARKKGIEKSDSRYLTFIDSDDFIDPTYLEKLTKTIKETDTNICFGRIAIHLDNDLLRNIAFKCRKYKMKKVNLLKQKEVLPAINVVTTSKLFKREYANITDKGFQANEDLSINYLNYALAQDVSFVNSAIYHYAPNDKGLVAQKIAGYNYENMLNTFLPLSELKNNFEKQQLDKIYSEELEALFIKNLFQRIEYIIDNVKERNKKIELISCILAYLEINYPYWTENTYYQQNFKSFEIPDIYKCLKVNYHLNKLQIHNKSNLDLKTEKQVLEKYKNLTK